MKKTITPGKWELNLPVKTEIVAGLGSTDISVAQEVRNPANASLICAAPDLLKGAEIALHHVLACAEHDELAARSQEQIGMHGSAAECRKMADVRRACADFLRDTIAKAKGEAA